MCRQKPCHSRIKWLGAVVGMTAAAYGVYTGITWLSYGHAKWLRQGRADLLLDVFMPNYDVAERHQTEVEAPAGITLSAAAAMNIEKRILIRAIFKGRELLLRSKPEDTVHPPGLLARCSLLDGAWADLPGREVVLGSVTRPWEPNPVFRALPPDEFAAFNEPGYVKIVFTLRADNAGSGNSVFRTETRAIATDPVSRKKFRRYWTFLSPGIVAIRRLLVAAVKREAEKLQFAAAA